MQDLMTVASFIYGKTRNSPKTTTNNISNYLQAITFGLFILMLKLFLHVMLSP